MRKIGFIMTGAWPYKKLAFQNRFILGSDIGVDVKSAAIE
jgi:hypothetical protein